MQTAMFMTEPKTDQRSSIQAAIYNSYTQLLEEIAGILKENHYSAHELYEILIHKGYLRPAYFKDFLRFMRWAVREGYIDKGRLVSKIVKGVRIPNRFTKEQLMAYFTTVKDPLIAVASFVSFWSGLRNGDTKKLRIEDFDFEAEIIKVVQSKRSKDRIAPFLRDAQSIIEKWIKYSGATDYLFPSYNSHSMATINTPHISARTLTNGFNKILKEANLQRVDDRYAMDAKQRKKFTWHTFRHTFCTYHMEHEVSVALVARAAGHSDMKTTLGVYGHMSTGSMIRAFRRSIEEGKRKTFETNPKLKKKRQDKKTGEEGILKQLAEKFITGEISEEVFRKKKQVLLDTSTN